MSQPVVEPVIAWRNGMLRLAWCVPLLLAVVACDWEELAIEQSDDPSTQWNGRYVFEVKAQTESDINGGLCGDGEGFFTVTGQRLVGTLTSTWGYSMALTGRVSAAGEIDADGTGHKADGVFDGLLSTYGGRGTWADAQACRSLWRAVLAW